MPIRNLYNFLIDSIKPHPVSFFSIYHHSVFLSGINVGLASPAHTNHSQIFEGIGSIHQNNTKELAKLIWSDNSLARSIGFASINSEYNTPKLLETASTQNAMELLLEKGAGKNVALLGDFPRLALLRKNNPFKNLWAFELNPPDESYYTPKDYEEILPQADVVLFTATTLINHTIFDFYKYIDKSYKILTGPSTPLHQAFWDCGIDAICGSVVTNEEEAKLYLSQGASYRSAKGLQKVTLLREGR